MKPHVITTIGELRTILDGRRAGGETVGFVPTMGYLHDGHGSLMRAASGNDLVVASIFVNPLQFAAGEDLDSYPRDLAGDQALAGDNGVGILFVPTVAEMYPFGPVLTSVAVADLSERWDGASRPTHFAGVATVVSKLFNIIGPCTAYFGEKDFQQLAIIRRMVADLSIPVDVVGCPIIREPDGLAMSSRNTYLSEQHRAAAVILRRTLDTGQAMLEAAESHNGPAVTVEAVETAMTAAIGVEPLARLDYLAVVDPLTLSTPDKLEPGSTVQLLIAAHLGDTRLIDNCSVVVGGPAATDPPPRAKP